MKCQLKYLPNRVSILEKCCDVVCEAKNGSPKQRNVFFRTYLN